MMHFESNPEHEDTEWARAVDNLIVLFSLKLARTMIKRLKAPKHVRMMVTMRLENLIKYFESNPS